MLFHPLRVFTLFGLFASALSAQTSSTPATARAPDLANNPAPAVHTLDPKLPTIFVAGDSTAAKGRGESQQGWAEPFADYFDAQKINIANRARGGRSSRTYVTEGLWDQVLADAKA